MPVADPRFTGLDLDTGSPPIYRACCRGWPNAQSPRSSPRCPPTDRPFRGRMGQNIENAVQASLGAFLRLATRGGDSASDPGGCGARRRHHELGRGEGARRPVHRRTARGLPGGRGWPGRGCRRRRSAPACPPGGGARFAELTFAYIDGSCRPAVCPATPMNSRRRAGCDSATSTFSGVNYSAARTPTSLRASAETAAWIFPRTLTAVLVPAAQAITRIAGDAEPASLQLGESLPGLDPSESWSVTLVPDADGTRRPALLPAFLTHGHRRPNRPVDVGPGSYLRALRARRLGPTWWTPTSIWWSWCSAPTRSRRDLRRRALAPGRSRQRPAERLAETLRSWLLNQGRRDAVAAELFVHPQTVRWMNQVRPALRGTAQHDPGVVLELTVALGIPRARKALALRQTDAGADLPRRTGNAVHAGQAVHPTADLGAAEQADRRGRARR